MCKMEWISVKKRLPNDDMYGHKFLVHHKERGIYEDTWFVDGYKRSWNRTTDYENITHYIPYPERPEY